MRKRVMRKRRNPWQSFSYWFNSYEDFLMRYDPHRFYMNILYFVILALVTFILYLAADILNEINLFVVGLGSLMLLIGLYFSLEFLYLVIRDGRKKYHNTRKGLKALLMILFISVLIFAVLNQGQILNGIITVRDSTDFDRFNLFSVSKSVGSGDVVDVNALSSKMDMRTVFSFVPIPFGYLMIWLVFACLILIALIGYMYFGEVPKWIVAVLVIAFIVMFFSYKIPYDVTPTSGVGSCDNRGSLVFELSDSFSQPCVQYRSSECRPDCRERQTVCQCEASLYDFVFKYDGSYMYTQR